MKYIDVHCHVFPPNIAGKVVAQLESYYGYHWEGNGLIEDLLASMDRVGITRSVIFSSATKPSQVQHINDYICDLQTRYPDRFIGFGTIHPDFDDYENEIIRIRRMGLHGLKFHPDFQRFFIDEPKMLRIYEAAGASLPMLFHIGDRKTDFSSPSRLSRVIEALPELKVIAAHMGGYSEWEEAWRCLIGKNVWLDVSSTMPRLAPSEVRRMALAHGTDRILFASDYPAVHHDHAIADVMQLGFSERENENIFYRNAEALLGLSL